MKVGRDVAWLWRDGALNTAGLRRPGPMRWLWVGVAIIWALGGIRMFLFHISYDPFTDIHVYYDAAARLNAGLPLFPPGARIYPPLFSILFRPLALLPFEIAAAIWESILVASLGLTLWRIGIRRAATWWAPSTIGTAPPPAVMRPLLDTTRLWNHVCPATPLNWSVGCWKLAAV